MTRLTKQRLLDRLTKIKLSTCESCFLAGKITKKSFAKALKASNPLESIHFDICKPMNIRAHHGVVYYLMFIDNYS